MALDFTSANGDFMAGNSGSPSGEEMTVATWVKTNAVTPSSPIGRTVHSIDDGNSDGWEMRLGSLGGDFVLGDFSFWTQPGPIVENEFTGSILWNENDGLWHHLLVTYKNGNGAIMYLDGSSVFTNAASGPMVYSSYKHSVGRSIRGGGGSTDFMDGQSAELCFWDKELTAAQVLELYSGGMVSDMPLLIEADNLIFYLPLDDWEEGYVAPPVSFQKSFPQDRSGNGNHLDGNSSDPRVGPIGRGAPLSALAVGPVTVSRVDQLVSIGPFERPFVGEPFSQAWR